MAPEVDSITAGHTILVWICTRIHTIVWVCDFWICLIRKPCRSFLSALFVLAKIADVFFYVFLVEFLARFV